MTRKLVVPIVVAVALVATGAWFALRPKPAATELLAAGTVEATDARLGFQAGGRLVQLTPHEGDRVKAGDELGRLDSTETEARKAQAAAQVGVAQAQLQELERGSRREEIVQAHAALDAASERLKDAERDAARNRELYDGRAIPRQVLDKSEVTLDVARAQKTQAQEQLRLVEVGPRAERIAAARAQLAQAEASLRTIQATLQNLVLVAPFDGVVTVRHREPGEILAPGAPVLTVMQPDDRWVRIYVKEDRLGAVRLGMPATIACDTFPGKRYRGEVTYIASEAEFTPKSVQTSEERVKLVYAVKVRIVDDTAHELKPGLPADVRLALAPAEKP